jgi:hypothetical protein
MRRSSRDDADFAWARGEQSFVPPRPLRISKATRSSVNSADRSYAAAKIMKATTEKLYGLPGAFGQIGRRKPQDGRWCVMIIEAFSH